MNTAENRSVLINIAIAFVIGVFIGYIMKFTFGSLFSRQTIEYCPSAEMVKNNIKDLSTWTHDKRQWTTYSGGAVPDANFLFDQAMLQTTGNKLNCYYRWPDKAQPGNYQTMYISLSPASNEVIIPYGQHWRRTSVLAICNASDPKTCGFFTRTGE